MTGKDSYHHGALRKALLAAALEILETEGLAALSLRRVAAKVGVSHAAPAHHFPTLKALLTGLAVIGFQRFDAAMRAARDEASQTPVEQLRAASRGYLAYAVKNPALFRLMFTVTAIDWDAPELGIAAEEPRRQLSEVCAPAAESLGIAPGPKREALEHMVWAQIHGLAHLAIDQKLPGDGFVLLESAFTAGTDVASLLFR